MARESPLNNEAFDTEIAHLIWSQRYRHGGSGETSIMATWQRVANALAAAEPGDQAGWAARFLEALRGFCFLPGGRILAGAGTPHRVTLLNCFVMGAIEDSIPGIFHALEEGARTMQQGGGVGYDFSTLRPHGMLAKGAGAIASGPVSFMAVWEAMCATIQSTGARRGAMMATLRCDHPDIERFIAAKSTPGQLTHFNLSVQITDDFMRAVADDAPWVLKFPATPPHMLEKKLRARSLWRALLDASLLYGEPGLLFIDRINQTNNLCHSERISATNPCGEVPLPPYGGCDLGSFNLTALVRDPFTPNARLDMDELRRLVPVAVRLLDNVLDITRFPLPQQAEQARAKRRIGLGITGLADALLMLNLPYGAPKAIALAGTIMREICHGAYRASAALAAEKGPYPAWMPAQALKAPFIQPLPADIRAAIAAHGLRNSHLLAIAPAGTISLLAGNISSGAEPIFAADAIRTILDALGTPRTLTVTDYAVALWRRQSGRPHGLPPAFQPARAIAPADQLAMLAALQTHTDQSISKTILLPPGATTAMVADIFIRAHALGLKGCTVFQPDNAARTIIAPAPA